MWLVCFRIKRIWINFIDEFNCRNKMTSLSCGTIRVKGYKLHWPTTRRAKQWGGIVKLSNLQHFVTVTGRWFTVTVIKRCKLNALAERNFYFFGRLCYRVNWFFTPNAHGIAVVHRSVSAYISRSASYWQQWVGSICILKNMRGKMYTILRRFVPCGLRSKSCWTIEAKRITVYFDCLVPHDNIRIVQVH